METPRDAARPEAPEEVPDWLKKKTEKDQSAFSQWMADEQRQLLRLFDDKAAAIDFTNGIDAAEAELIGGAYFTMKFGGCGGTEKATDGEKEWLMRPRFGVTGAPLSEFIRVDKRTGAVRYSSGPATEGKTAIEYERELLQKSVEQFEKRALTR